MDVHAIAGAVNELLNAYNKADSTQHVDSTVDHLLQVVGVRRPLLEAFADLTLPLSLTKARNDLIRLGKPDPNELFGWHTASNFHELLQWMICLLLERSDSSDPVSELRELIRHKQPAGKQDWLRFDPLWFSQQLKDECAETAFPFRGPWGNALTDGTIQFAEPDTQTRDSHAWIVPVITADFERSAKVFDSIHLRLNQDLTATNAVHEIQRECGVVGGSISRAVSAGVLRIHKIAGMVGHVDFRLDEILNTDEEMRIFQNTMEYFCFMEDGHFPSYESLFPMERHNGDELAMRIRTSSFSRLCHFLASIVRNGIDGGTDGPMLSTIQSVIQKCEALSDAMPDNKWHGGAADLAADLGSAVYKLKCDFKSWRLPEETEAAFGQFRLAWYDNRFEALGNCAQLLAVTIAEDFKLNGIEIHETEDEREARICQRWRDYLDDYELPETEQPLGFTPSQLVGQLGGISTRTLRG